MQNKVVPEQLIRFAILDKMSDRKVWTNAELKKSLAKMLPWTEHDLGQSKNRKDEARWENRVNNALSPERPNSLYANGWVEKISHGEYRITDLGYDYATSD